MKLNKVLKRYLLGYVYRYKFKRTRAIRHQKAIIIQRWFRNKWRILHGSLKKVRQNAIKTIEAYLRSYQVFMKYRDFIYQSRLKNCFLFFGRLREGLLSKSQKIIRKHWLRVRDTIRARRREQEDAVRRALRKFTIMLYIKAK